MMEISYTSPPAPRGGGVAILPLGTMEAGPRKARRGKCGVRSRFRGGKCKRRGGPKRQGQVVTKIRAAEKISIKKYSALEEHI